MTWRRMWKIWINNTKLLHEAKYQPAKVMLTTHQTIIRSQLILETWANADIKDNFRQFFNSKIPPNTHTHETHAGRW